MAWAFPTLICDTVRNGPARWAVAMVAKPQASVIKGSHFACPDCAGWVHTNRVGSPRHLKARTHCDP